MVFTFRLGFSEELARLELETVTGQSSVRVDDHQYRVNLPDGLRQMNYDANRLGGLIEVTDESNKVVWRHNAKAWFKRDRGKPYSDRQKGLLPPKIARILVNLAVGTSDPEGKILLDPFCGSGTILLEAGLMKIGLVGNDFDPVQIAGARRNLDFFGLNSKLMTCEATALSEHLKENVDFVATEPYMGRPGVRADRLPDLAKGLMKLYLGCLKDWYKFIKPSGRIAMIFPVFEYQERQYKTSAIIDDPKLIGYNISNKDLIYYRPEARLKREIVVLTKK